MVLSILIFVVLHILAEFNRPHLPDTKRKDEDTEGVTDNKEPDTYPGKSKILIQWEILHRIFGAALMDCSF